VSTKIDITITFISDWHIGTGTGIPGFIDSVITRDADDFPCLPGKSLHGVWRDACETVADTLGDDWPKLVHVLFGGRPKPGAGTAISESGALLLPTARIAPGLRAEIKRLNLQATLTTLRPGISIDPDTQQSKTDFFRLVEMAANDLPLQVCAELHLGADGLASAKALLWGGAQLLDSIGGFRRRGAGRCELTLEGIDRATALAALGSNCKMSIGNPSRASSLTPSIAQSPAAFSVELALALEQPVIAGRSVVGNVVESLDFIPGTLLLPALMPHLSALTRNAGALRGQISAGNVQVRHALPSIDGARALPLPMCLHAIKERPTQVCNPATQTESKQLKQLRGDYGLRKGGSIKMTRPALCLGAHSTIEEESQRPTSAVGGVYMLQAIAAEQMLRMTIDVNEAAALVLTWDAQSLDGLQDQTLRIGVAKKSDYGLVRVVSVAPSTPAVAPTGDDLWLCCASDWLLRDANLRPRADVETVKAALAAAAPDDLKAEVGKITVSAAHSYARMRRTEGFHTQSGLARSSYIGVMAGSCYRLRLANTPPALLEFFDDLQRTGVGERRAEGYGEVRITAQWSLSASVTAAVVDLDAVASSSSAVALTEAERALIWRLQLRKLPMDIALIAQEKATPEFIENSLRWGRAPSHSQLGELREALMRGDIASWRARFLRDRAPQSLADAWEFAREFWRTDAGVCSVFGFDCSKFAYARCSTAEKAALWHQAACSLFLAAFQRKTSAPEAEPDEARKALETQS